MLILNPCESLEVMDFMGAIVLTKMEMEGPGDAGVPPLAFLYSL